MAPFCISQILLLYFVDRDRLRRAVLHTGQAVDALGHIHRLGLAAVNLEYGLGTDIGAGAAAVAFVLVNRYHVHVICFLLE